jgi:hypothetical protein
VIFKARSGFNKSRGKESIELIKRSKIKYNNRGKDVSTKTLNLNVLEKYKKNKSNIDIKDINIPDLDELKNEENSKINKEENSINFDRLVELIIKTASIIILTT